MFRREKLIFINNHKKYIMVIYFFMKILYIKYEGVKSDISTLEESKEQREKDDTKNKIV